jgi:N-acetylmuramoyl-L-alanine amidase
MKITDCLSPNFDSREGHVVDMLVLHYTGMKTAAEACDRMCDRAAKVSAHYMVHEDGAITRLVAEECRAWHAGLSSWRGNTNINQRSIGIEIVNPGHEFGYRPFPAAQMKAVTMLARDILARHPIPPRNVVAHSDIAPSRKEDPGELFEWQTLAKLGVGLWPIHPAGRAAAQDPVLAQYAPQDLQHYGYDTADLPKAITAFQRHFRPKSLNGQWDNECAALLAALLEMV